MMGGLIKVIKEERNAKVKFNILPSYHTVTCGHKTWYWIKETGAFDGTSWDKVKPFKVIA